MMNTKEMILACAASSLGEGAKRASELGKKGSAFLVSLMLLLVISSGAEAAERDEIVFFMPDALGSAVVAVGEAGQPCWSESYTPYGSKTLDEDVWPENTGCGIAGAERGFTGHTEDVATDLTYMKHRFYDPSIGRFLSVDPLDADPTKPLTFNRYAYANNNPHRFVDPDGRDARDVLIIQNDIAQLFPEIASNIQVEYRDLDGMNGLTSRLGGKIYLPTEAETETLDRESFSRLYATVFHESMHATDGFLSMWGKSIVDFWAERFNGSNKEGPKHQEIYNREYYELQDTRAGPPTYPVWSNGPPPESPAGVDTDKLFDETRENE